jgi:hypothetical protein
VACTLTTPLDVAKTRVMTQNPSNPMIYLGLQATLQKIWLEEVSGLGTGMRDPLDYSFRLPMCIRLRACHLEASVFVFFIT